MSRVEFSGIYGSLLAPFETDAMIAAIKQWKN